MAWSYGLGAQGWSLESGVRSTENTEEGEGQRATHQSIRPRFFSTEYGGDEISRGPSMGVVASGESPWSPHLRYGVTYVVQTFLGSFFFGPFFYHFPLSCLAPFCLALLDSYPLPFPTRHRILASHQIMPNCPPSRVQQFSTDDYVNGRTLLYVYP